MNFSSKQRLLKAIEGGIPDRLPVTTHHLQRYFLNKYMNGVTENEFFEYFGLDQIVWLAPQIPNENRGEYFHNMDEPDVLKMKFIISDQWQIEWEKLPCDEYPTVRYNIITPEGKLTTVMQANEYTVWVHEHLIKEKKDIELIGKYATMPICDIAQVNKVAQDYGQKALIRGNISCFDIFGQPGTWQDAACLYGIEKLIMATYDDPKWVHEFLTILKNRKTAFADSLEGAEYDILELGGGDASSTVISPKIFEEFVAPYDTEIIRHAQKSGQRIVYHTCGGMMPIIENIVSMRPDAMETFTPKDMGGDTNLAEARKLIPQDICMIGGFDQFHFFKDCTPQDTRFAVRKYFDQAGCNGGCILAPSDHFFDADVELIAAFADEAGKCVY